jgi:4-hydroxyphenylpyruvate dioxygenase
VLAQGRIRLVLTGTLHADSDIAAHAHAHGDGVKVIALSVPDAEYAYRTALEKGARGVEAPREESDEHGRVKLATIETYGETVHTFVERGEYTGPFLPGYTPAAARPATSACWPSTTSSATSSSATCRSGSATTSASSA